jgi:hypothetical protein
VAKKLPLFRNILDKSAAKHLIKTTNFYRLMFNIQL